MSDELAEAERWLLQYFDGGDEFTRKAGLVMAEYDRRADLLDINTAAIEQRDVELDRLRAVEKAAAALVERWDNGDFRVGPVGAELLTALAAVLNGDVT